MNDERDFLQRTAQASENRTGEAWGPDKLLESFHLYGDEKRCAALDYMDAQVHSADTSDLRKYSQLCSLRRQMQKAHYMLRQAGVK